MSLKHLASLLPLACLLAFPLGAGAQEQPEQTLKFSAYLWNEPEGRVLTKAAPRGPDGAAMVGEYIPLRVGFIDAEGQLNNFDMAARTFSKQQEYKGPSQMVFAIENPNAGPDRPPYIETGRVNVPQNTDEAILFFFPRGNAATPSYDISLLPTGAKDIPSGQAMVINLSDTPLAAKLGDQRVALQPEGSQRVSLSGLVNNRLPLMLAAQESNGRWQLKLERNISMAGDTALLILLHKNNGNYRVENIRLRR